jgi:hypothetical protein
MVCGVVAMRSGRWRLRSGGVGVEGSWGIDGGGLIEVGIRGLVEVVVRDVVGISFTNVGVRHWEVPSIAATQTCKTG